MANSEYENSAVPGKSKRHAGCGGSGTRMFGQRTTTKSLAEGDKCNSVKERRDAPLRRQTCFFQLWGGDCTSAQRKGDCAVSLWLKQTTRPLTYPSADPPFSANSSSETKSDPRFSIVICPSGTFQAHRFWNHAPTMIQLKVGRATWNGRAPSATTNY